MLEDATSALRSSCSAAGSALVADVLRRGGRLRLQVRGESMLPTLWPGDVVEIASCSLDDVRPGEIVLARRDGRLFLHRLAAPCTPNGFLLRGDSMPGPDPRFPPEALLGRLVRRLTTGTPSLHPRCARGLARRGWVGNGFAPWECCSATARCTESCAEASQPPQGIGARISNPGTLGRY